MKHVNDLGTTPGPRAPQKGNLAFFRAQGNCQAPDVQDGDLLFATWRLSPASRIRLATGELAVFLIKQARHTQPMVVLKRWYGPPAGSDSSLVSLGTAAGTHSFLAGQVHLLADHVRLMPRGWTCSPGLLAGTVYAGLDLWFADDVMRILASAHETMTAATRATPPLNVETAEAYQQGFVDALRAVAVAFGVMPPGLRPQGSRTVIDVETRQPGIRSLTTGSWQ